MDFFRMTWKGFWVAGAAGGLVIVVVAAISRWTGLLPIQLGLALALAFGRIAEAVYSNSCSSRRLAVETAIMFVAGLLIIAVDEMAAAI